MKKGIVFALGATLLLTSCDLNKIGGLFGSQDINNPNGSNSSIDKNDLPLKDKGEINVLPFEALKGKDVTITMWNGFNSYQNQILDGILNDFRAKYPNIQVLNYYKGYEEALDNAIKESITNNNTPDIFFSHSHQLAEYLSHKDLVVPLDQYAASNDPEVGISPFCNDVSGDFIPGFINESLQLSNSYTYSLPFNMSTEVAYYNKDLLMEFGLSVPTTWQKLPDFARQIKNSFETIDGGLYGKVWTGPKTNKVFDFTNVQPGKFAPICLDAGATTFLDLLEYTDGKYAYKDSNSLYGHVDFYNPEVKNILMSLQSMANEGLIALPSYFGKKYASESLCELKSLYVPGTLAAARHFIPRYSNIEIDCAPIPYDELSGKKYVSQKGYSIGMFSDNTHLERLASWLLIRYLTTYINNDNNLSPNAEFGAKTTYLPSTYAGVNSKNYQNYLNSDFANMTAQKIIEVKAHKVCQTYIKQDWKIINEPAFIGSSIVREAINEMTFKVMHGYTNVDQALKESNEFIVQFLPRQ